MSRQIDPSQPLSDDEVQYLKDRDLWHVIELNEHLLAEGRSEPVDLDRLKVDELRALAAENDVSIPDDARKSDIIKILLEWQAGTGD